ncbi:hypothetical protein HKX48_000057 [Thoreauomyces humboldtii]|nr:hypothetical protein HKX48_000057 [Thoreauomyces humboldtii]
MGGLVYSADHAAMRRAVAAARTLPYDPSGHDWCIAAWDSGSGVVTDSNGFIRASIRAGSGSSSHRAKRTLFTPPALLDLVLQAVHTPRSNHSAPFLQPARPKTLRFRSEAAGSLPDGAIQGLSDLLAALQLGVEVAPRWDEDDRKPAEWWQTADAQIERERADQEERERLETEAADAARPPADLWRILWSLLLLLPFIRVLVVTWKRIVANPPAVSRVVAAPAHRSP